MARSSDATNDRYLQSSAALLGGSSGPFTVAFWFKAGSNAQSNTYILGSNVDGFGDQWAVIYEYVDNTVEFFISPGGDSRTGSGITVADTNWHHIAYRKAASGASVWDKFLDGVKTQISASVSFTISGGQDQITLFATENGVHAIVGECDCALAELGIWTSSLADAHIAALAKGYSIWLYNPDFGWDITGRQLPEISRIGSASFAVNGPVRADHPRIFYPTVPYYVMAPSVAPPTGYAHSWGAIIG